MEGGKLRGVTVCGRGVEVSGRAGDFLCMFVRVSCVGINAGTTAEAAATMRADVDVVWPGRVSRQAGRQEPGQAGRQAGGRPGQPRVLGGGGGDPAARRETPSHCCALCTVQQAEDSALVHARRCSGRAHWHGASGGPIGGVPVGSL